ncbi:MAG: FAD binding domain-containing protein [Acidimicrobiales bacterium]|nr:FAD binding domain-containing protein [Acidimicrobiales bacterium]
MLDVALARPASVEETLSILAEHGEDATVLAGGTAVVLLLRQGLISPAVVVSLDRLEELRGIVDGGGSGLRLGSLVPLRQAETSALVRTRHPTFAATLARVANVRIRHAATVGGNLAEADYASDPPCVLWALRARARVRSVRAERELPIAELLSGYYRTSLAPDELLTEVVVPDAPARSGSCYQRLVTGSSEDRPCAGAAAVVRTDEHGRCDELRVVASAVGPVPVELEAAEGMAIGQPRSDELVGEIASTYAREIEPLSDVRGSSWYRKRAIEVLVRRALGAAFDAALAGGDGPVG